MPKSNLDKLQEISRKRHEGTSEPVWKGVPTPEPQPEIVYTPVVENEKEITFTPPITYKEKLDFEEKVARIKAIAARVDLSLLRDA